MQMADMLYQILTQIIMQMMVAIAMPTFWIAAVLLAVQIGVIQKKNQKQVVVKLPAFLFVIVECWVYTILSGILGGVIASSLFLLTGISISYYDMFYVWMAMIFLFAIRRRFLCFAYAGGFLAVLQMISDVNGRFLLCYDGTAILILVTILHFTESILVWISGSVQQISVYFRSKKGTLTAKTQLRMCWPVPLALPVPILENASVDVPIGYFVMPEWWPLLGVVENMESAVIYQLMPVLAMIGYCDFAEQGNERKQTHKSSILLFLYSITLGALILISKDVPYMYCAAVLFSVLGHEGILWLGRIPMRKYVHTKKEQGFAKFISKKW